MLFLLTVFAAWTLVGCSGSVIVAEKGSAGEKVAQTLEGYEYTAVDSQTTAEVQKVMAGLARQGRTMIVVTHEMGFAREVSDRVLFMDGGRIAAAGTPGEIFDDPASDALRSFLRAMPKR